jgi:hypothetical protein
MILLMSDTIISSTKTDETLSYYNITFKDHNGYYYSSSGICDLDLADGLKDLLVKHDFNLELLVNTTSSDLSNSLGIDLDVAALILSTVDKQKRETRNNEIIV